MLHWPLYIKILASKCTCIFKLKYLRIVYIIFIRCTVKLIFISTTDFLRGFPGSSAGKVSTYKSGHSGLTPGLGRSPDWGHDNQLQHSCLENPHGQRSLAGCRLWGCKESEVQRVGHNSATKHSTALISNYTGVYLSVYICSLELLYFKRALFLQNNPDKNNLLWWNCLRISWRVSFWTFHPIFVIMDLFKKSLKLKICMAHFKNLALTA